MLISLTIRDMKIKTKMRYYLTLPPIAIIKKKKKKGHTKKTRVGKYMEKPEPSYILEEIKMVEVLWKTVWNAWDSLCFLHLVDYFLSHVRELFSYYSLMYFLRPLLSLFSLGPL